MEENKKNLSPEELDNVSGGSIAYPEEKVKKAGVYLQYEDGTPGSFGYLWNSGNYYFKGREISETDLELLIYYSEKYGFPAPSVQEARSDLYRERTWNYH